MQIEVDFEVFQLLTLLREDENDTYNDVLRRLLTVSEHVAATGELGDRVSYKPTSYLAAALLNGSQSSGGGAWMGNVFFPNGTKFRATYKGKTYRAEIADERWVDDGGVVRQSPSDAAGAISGTKVNGWRFWYAMRPADSDWRRLDDLRK